MGITDRYLAYQFDRTVELYSARVDQLLDEKREVDAPPRPKNAKPKVLKQKYTLERALQLASKPAQPKMSRVNSDFLIMLESGKTSMVD